LDKISAVLIDAGNLLPVTVIGAIILFIVKEILEARRRKKANARKRRAVRRLIADEIERNKWTTEKLRDGIQKIKDSIAYPELIVSVRIGANGEKYFRSEMSGELHSEFPFGKVHSEALSGNLLELAMIDESVFEEALSASDATKEVEHIINSMIVQLSDEGHLSHLEGFADYAKAEIADCERTLSNFYKTITGGKLEEHRVR
jgi:hypothetical protein